jgi:hypothetical protein
LWSFPVVAGQQYTKIINRAGFAVKEKTIIFYVAGVAALGCAAVLGYYFVWPIYKEGELSKAKD